MLAFEGLERDESGALSDDAELGADLHGQAQAAILNIERMLNEFFTGAVRTAGKKP